MTQEQQRSLHASACFLRACQLDVAVRKPGNVSLSSPGHGMHADLFIASARAAAGPLFALGARVGQRIEAGVAATQAVAGCNTNLGILLLCAPIAAAIERKGALAGSQALRHAINAVLDGLDLEDSRATYRAIALAQPGGLGHASDQDVRLPPSLGLRAAMALAADRDSIARQYSSGYADLFELGLPVLESGFALRSEAGVKLPTAALVQRVFLTFLSRLPDSHIVRKHGSAMAHSVMEAAQIWLPSPAPDTDPAFSQWDEAMKAQGVNPGTSADLTVATLLLAGLLARSGLTWHES